MFNMQTFVKKFPNQQMTCKNNQLISAANCKKNRQVVNYAEQLIINEFQLVMWNYLPNSSIT